MGGHVFEIKSSSIKKEHIETTLDEFLNELERIFPNYTDCRINSIVLGSAGKKDISGDIDLGFDEKYLENLSIWNINKEHVDELFAKFKKRARTATDHQLMKRAVITAIAEKINDTSNLIKTDLKQSGSGVLYCQFPQYDEQYRENGLLVQIDINFGKLEWLKFAYYSDAYEGNIKGLHRTQLMLHMFANKGYVFSHNYGVKNKETQEIVVTTPQEAIDFLNKLYNIKLDEDILRNYNRLQKYLRTQLSKSELNNIYDIYLKTLDSTRCDIPEDMQEYWIENQEKLGLTGKFLPETSNLIKYQTCQDQ